MREQAAVSNSEPQPESRRRRHRWYQYSLRTALVVMLLTGVGVSWFATKARQARRQREAVQAIVKLGGSIQYDLDLDGMSRESNTDEPWLQTLPRSGALASRFQHLLGKDSVGAVVWAVIPKQTQVSDKHLKQLADLSQLRVLWIWNGADVSDAGLRHLKGLAKLRVLSLGGSGVTDEGVKKLQQTLPECEIIR